MIAKLARDEVQRGHRWTWDARRVAQTLARKDVLGVVAARPDAPVTGFAVAGYGDDVAHLLLLAVHPSARRTGLGTELLNWHHKCALVAGVGALELELRAQNRAALRFYETLGYEVIGRVRGYYQHDEDALVMRRDLRST